MKIYIASKVKHAPKWRELRATGLNIISTWIDESEEGQTKDRRDLALRCIHESISCDLLLLYAEEGDTLKGALIEAGAALAVGKYVLAVGPVLGEHSAFRSHTRWRNYDHLQTALNYIKLFEERGVKL